MDKEINTNNSSEKSKINKYRLKITKQNLNDINDYILNFQRYYELIKNNPSLSPNKKPKELDFNTINLESLHKKIPYNKLQNDINIIYKRVYTDNNNENNNIINNKYNSLINQEKVYFSNNMLRNTCKKTRIKLIKNEFNSKEKFSNEKIEEALKVNMINTNNTKIKKYEYGNYAMNNTNFNHPQIYLLQNNKSYDMKRKLPQINNKSGLRIAKAGDLSKLIPQNTKKAKFRNNFYNYYIGMKHSKHNFNI